MADRWAEVRRLLIGVVLGPPAGLVVIAPLLWERGSFDDTSGSLLSNIAVSIVGSYVFGFIPAGIASIGMVFFACLIPSFALRMLASALMGFGACFIIGVGPLAAIGAFAALILTALTEIVERKLRPTNDP